MIKGNIGEWSEIYTLLKIVGDKKLFAGNSDLEKLESLIFPIIKVLRDESNGTFEYSYDNDIVVISGNEQQFRIPLSKFKELASQLLQYLKTFSETTSSFPDIELFLNSFNCYSLKAKSSVKSDIRIIIHDQRTGTKPELGFSIKSQLGKPATLFNSSQGSNFIYRIDEIKLSHNQIEEINNLNTRSKIQDRVKMILAYGATLNFQKTEGSIFHNNLTLIDSLLPEILSEIIINFSTSKFNKLIDLIETIKSKNPLNFDISNNHSFYNYKIKRLLSDIALGMVPTTVWTGQLDTTGGYLVIKEDGEILCYHIYNRNEFEDYLLANTKIINPSSTRLKFGKVYEQNRNQYFKLNLQIRFIK
ncbi:HpaII family restriction endonuclease [uncultured Algibacter sp.]|uniref:HpaII family restriction endonuclease n=1 Tax=uncultured Algibacter sp. TaxID=298659 RepID=UPI00261D02E9|nr:HpaII family restriction endonuclease [uncultured Algibacter sp.]